MKITVLNDNAAGKKCGAEHGLSFLIEADTKILFDAGPSDIFLRNAKVLGANLEDIAAIILSHGHYDHGNGLAFIRGKKLVCHPGCFVKRYRKKDGGYIGLPLSLEEAKERFELVLSKGPYWLSKSVAFLGEIPHKNGFEAKKTTFWKEGMAEDFVNDDSALAIRSEKGLIVITGCSHAGICNIIEHAKKVSGINKVYAVVGGFHLEEDDDVLVKTVEYFKKEGVGRVYPSHCTDLPALARFYDAFRISQLHSGDTVEL